MGKVRNLQYNKNIYCQQKLSTKQKKYENKEKEHTFFY